MALDGKLLGTFRRRARSKTAGLRGPGRPLLLCASVHAPLGLVGKLVSVVRPGEASLQMGPLCPPQILQPGAGESLRPGYLFHFDSSTCRSPLHRLSLMRLVFSIAVESFAVVRACNAPSRARAVFHSFIRMPLCPAASGSHDGGVLPLHVLPSTRYAIHHRYSLPHPTLDS